MRTPVLLLTTLLVACAPTDPEEHLRHATGEQARGNNTRARALYRDFLEKYPDDPRGAKVRFELGMTYFEQENYQLAVREFTVVANDFPQAEVLFDALFYGGVAHARMGHCPDALHYLSIVVGGTEGRTAPPKLQADAQKKMDQLNDDMQGPHRLCTVKPRG